MEAHRPVEPAAQSPRDPALLPCRRFVSGNLFARWHEPCGEGIRRRQRRRTRSAYPQLLYRRGSDLIQPYYRAADLCLVTSLHDGMNLVAKEFVAARGDQRGVLILSCFTGAAPI